MLRYISIDSFTKPKNLRLSRQLMLQTRKPLRTLTRKLLLIELSKIKSRAPYNKIWSSHTRINSIRNPEMATLHCLIKKMTNKPAWK